MLLIIQKAIAWDENRGWCFLRSKGLFFIIQLRFSCLLLCFQRHNDRGWNAVSYNWSFEILIMSDMQVCYLLPFFVCPLLLFTHVLLPTICCKRIPPNSCLFNACTVVDWFCVIKIQSYRYVLLLCKTSCVQSDVVLSGDENRVGNYDEASIRYRGNHIPSPSFRLLQTLAKEDKMKNKTGSRKLRSHIL